VQLWVADPTTVGLAGGAVPELRHDEPIGVHAAHAAAPGSGVPGVRLEVGDAPIDGFLVRGDDHLLWVFVGQRPQHRHRLRRRERYVHRCDLV